MKLFPFPQGRTVERRGNVLLVVIVINSIIGLALASYLTLVSNQNRAVARSQVWNSALTVAEAGAEEALTHCYNNYASNMAANGWAISGTAYFKSNAMQTASPAASLAGSMALLDGFYTVAITTNLPYVITSTGFYPMPGSSGYLSRTIRVTTRNLGVFFGSIVVKNNIDMNGNNVTTDSYDSTDPAKSTLGKYDAAKAGDKGDVACINGLTDSLSVGNANVWGHVFTGPSGTVNVGANGSVGEVSWQQAGKTGLEPGWWQNDLNFSLPDVQVPFTSAAPPAGGLVGLLSYNYVLGNGNYKMSNLGNDVVVTGNAVLYVTDNIKFNPSDVLRILPGASLRLYCAAGTAIFSAIDNQNTDPSTFVYYGLPSNLYLTVKGQNPWIGRIYAPNAQFTLNGTAVVHGSVVAQSAKMTGNAAIHYDESQINQLPSRGFIAVNWEEL
jgi:hypothetical protein